MADDAFHEHPNVGKPPIRAAEPVAVTYRTLRFLAPVALFFEGPQRFVSISLGAVCAEPQPKKPRLMRPACEASNQSIAASIEPNN
jgi:hypothetical protein